MTDGIRVMPDEKPAECDGLWDGRDDDVDGREHPLARREGRIEVQRQELLLAIHVDRGDTWDALAAGDDVLCAALADELKHIDSDLVIRGARNHLHRR
jgi:hypothetical protein